MELCNKSRELLPLSYNILFKNTNGNVIIHTRLKKTEEQIELHSRFLLVSQGIFLLNAMFQNKSPQKQIEI